MEGSKYAMSLLKQSAKSIVEQIQQTSTHLELAVVGKASHRRVLKLEVQNAELLSSEGLVVRTRAQTVQLK